MEKYVVDLIHMMCLCWQDNHRVGIAYASKVDTFSDETNNYLQRLFWF